MFSSYGIKFRAYLIDSIRREGYLAFRQPDLEHRGFFGEYLDECLFSLNQDHILGTQAQFDSGLATCYYNGSEFKGFTSKTRRLTQNRAVSISFENYDRITIIIDTLDLDITFPDKFLILKNYNSMDMDGFDFTIQGRVDGELNISAGTGSVVNLSGQVEGLIVNIATATVNFTGSGTYFLNGVLTT